MVLLRQRKEQLSKEQKKNGLFRSRRQEVVNGRWGGAVQERGAH